MDKESPLVGTVVLNYKTFNDTIACVDSLKQQSYSPQRIIVVENGSGNESAKVLRRMYDDDDMVCLIVSEENLGFARGNNLGIRFAHETLGCDFVFVLNSDTIVPNHVFDKVIKAYQDDVGTISPSVANVNGLLVPPSENSDDIMRQIKVRERGLRIARILSLPGISSLYNCYKGRKIQIEEGEENSKNVWVPGKYVLQGCSYFLTPAFFNAYSQLYPNTFLYWEEINLLVYLYKANLRSIAINTPPIIHKEAGSTASLYSNKENNKRKLQFSVDSYRNSKKMFRMTFEEIRDGFN